MNNSQFVIDIVDLYWINGENDNMFNHMVFFNETK